MQHNLGNALEPLGARGSGAVRREQALTTDRQAAYGTGDRCPLNQYAMWFFLAFNLAPALGLPPGSARDRGRIARSAADLVAGHRRTDQRRARHTCFPTEGHLEGGRTRPDGAAACGRGPTAGSCRGVAPAELEHQFVIASLATNAIVWLVLGGLTALFFSNLDRWIGDSLRPTEST
jgi:hypothetical protein